MRQCAAQAAQAAVEGPGGPAVLVTGQGPRCRPPPGPVSVPGDALSRGPAYTRTHLECRRTEILQTSPTLIGHTHFDSSDESLGRRDRYHCPDRSTAILAGLAPSVPSVRLYPALA